VFYFSVRIKNSQELMTSSVDDKPETKKVDINEDHDLFEHINQDDSTHIKNNWMGIDL
jgi:hypothetical protein